jgi:hypothetical protein
VTKHRFDGIRHKGSFSQPGEISCHNDVLGVAGNRFQLSIPSPIADSNGKDLTVVIGSTTNALGSSNRLCAF